MLIPLQLTESAATNSAGRGAAPLDGGTRPGASEGGGAQGAGNAVGKEEFVQLVSEGRGEPSTAQEADPAPASEVEPETVAAESAEDEDALLLADEEHAQSQEGGQGAADGDDTKGEDKSVWGNELDGQGVAGALTDSDVQDVAAQPLGDVEAGDEVDLVARETNASPQGALAVGTATLPTNKNEHDAAPLINTAPTQDRTGIRSPLESASKPDAELVNQKATNSKTITPIQTVAETAVANQLQAFEKAQPSATDKTTEGGRLETRGPASGNAVVAQPHERSVGAAPVSLTSGPNSDEQALTPSKTVAPTYSAIQKTPAPLESGPKSQVNVGVLATNLEPKDQRIDGKGRRKESAISGRDTIVQSTSAAGPYSSAGGIFAPTAQPVPPPQMAIAMPVVAQQRNEDLHSKVDPELAVVSRASTGVAGTPEPVVHGPAMPRQIAQQLVEAIQRAPGKPVEVRLSPEELGRVRLAISTHEMGVSVMLQVERPETLDLIRRHLDQLAQDFHALGYGEVDFAFAKEGSLDDGDEPLDSGHEDVETEAQSVVSVDVQSGSNTGLDLRL